MKNNIPNFFTLLNLTIGFYCIINVLNGESISSILLLFYFCLALDFLDGFFARRLNVISEFGKQLDSLADLISFGALPSTVLFFHMAELSDTDLKYFSFLILIFSVIRLAKFNLADENNNFFEGLPTPANALFFISISSYNGPFNSLITKEIFIGLILFFSFLMISNIKFMNFKFKSFDFQRNKEKYITLLIPFVLLLLYGHSILFLIVFSYVIYSLSKALITRLYLK